MSVSSKKDDDDSSSSSDSSSDDSSSSDESDEFEFGKDGKKAAAAGGGEAKKDEAEKKAKPVDFQHYDEAMSVSEDEQSIDESVTTPEVSPQNQKKGRAPPAGAEGAAPAAPTAAPAADKDKDDDDSSSSSDSSSSDEEDNDSSAPAAAAKLYNKDDYTNLSVTSEIQDLFDYIGRHKPNDIELETKLKPFIPDFIPAVGEIDAFVKIPPPDGSNDNLGLNVLDEPAANQSDPTVLDIQLRVVSKEAGLKPMTVRSIENADKTPKKITTWITNIEDVHRKKPPPTVNYSKNMPDIEALMQVWSPQFEEILKNTPLPSAELDLEVAEYIRVCCALLDIPVHDNKVTESLHVLLTLYTEFKNNSHFN